jgi:antitoxin component of RelBE/YafQ-DinJ toxin-antitoxin module
MKARVNLTIDERVLHDAKMYAEKQDISVSEIVEEYLKKITRPIKRKTIIDMVEDLKPADIDLKANLKELYYQERAKKYGF